LNKYPSERETLNILSLTINSIHPLGDNSKSMLDHFIISLQKLDTSKITKNFSQLLAIHKNPYKVLDNMGFLKSDLAKEFEIEKDKNSSLSDVEIFSNIEIRLRTDFAKQFFTATLLRAEALDRMKLTRMCCREAFLSPPIVTMMSGEHLRYRFEPVTTNSGIEDLPPEKHRFNHILPKTSAPSIPQGLLIQ